MLVVRLYCAAISAFIFTVYMPNPGHLLYRLSPYANCESDYCMRQWFLYESLGLKIKIIMGVLWMAAWAFLEVRSARRSRAGLPVSKLVTHLRYGPIAIMALSIAMILTFDALLIQYSRWQIVRYIHSDAPVTERPSLNLYNNDRGFCVNGIAASEYALYGHTPVAYIDDPDPAVRARALQASMYVYDWINYPSAGPSIEALRKAARDPDPMVRDLAERFSAELAYTGSP